MGRDVALSVREVEQIHPWKGTRICNIRIAEKLGRNHKVVSNYSMKKDIYNNAFLWGRPTKTTARVERGTIRLASIKQKFIREIQKEILKTLWYVPFKILFLSVLL